MRKYINWPCWFVAATGGGWAIYLMNTLPGHPSVKDMLTIGVLFLVSIVLLETKAVRHDPL